MPRLRRKLFAAYRKSIAAKTDLERQENKEKTGVFLGSYAVNPVNGHKVPIFIADYVLTGYGTGAIMAVPGHDHRDWEFANAFGLDILEVIAGGNVSEAAYSGDGPLVNSDYLDGLDVAEAKATVISRLEESGQGKGTIQYKLRDWLFARQRYWGEPFPIVYDADGNAHASAGFGSARGASGGRGLRTRVLRSGRRQLRALSPAEQGDRLGQRRARSR